MEINLEQKLISALEHVSCLEELFVDNEWEINLILPLSTIKYELVNQLNNERKRKQKPIK